MWGPALAACVGVSVPLADRLRVSIEGRLLVTHDVDVRGYPKDWHVDTSGTPTIVGQAHLDTRFYALTMGIELRL